MRDYSADRWEQLKAIKNGKGMQYILNKAYEVLGNPVAIYDLTEYKLLACAENIVTDDPFLNELLTQGAFSNETMKFCKEESWFDAVANEDVVTFIERGELKYDRILGELFNRDNILVAGLVVVACDRLFEEDDLKLVETISKIISKELSKSEFYHDYGHAFRETLVRKLIKGSIQDKGFYSPYVADIYEGLQTNIYLALVDIAQPYPEHTQLTYFRDLFMMTQKEFKYCIYAEYIVIIISTDEAILNVKEDLKKLNKIFSENNLSVGISSSFENLYELRKYYNEAVKALNYGLEANDSQRIFLYDEIRQDTPLL